MGMHDSSLLHLIQKAKSWISLGIIDNSNSVLRLFETMDENCSMCCHCKRKILQSDPKCHCQSCGRTLCDICAQTLVSLEGVKKHMESLVNITSCKLCSELGPLIKSDRKCSGKIYPSESPRESPEPPSPSFSGERFGGLSSHTSPVSSANCRSDEEDGEYSTSCFLSAPSEYFHSASDVELASVSGRHEFYSSVSVGSSQSGSPSKARITLSGHVQLEQGGSQNYGPFVDQQQVVLERPAKEELPQPLDFEDNGLVWFPPPPDDINDEVENNLFAYEDDDDEVGDSGAEFSPTDIVDTVFLDKEKQVIDNKGSWRNAVQGYFRNLVLQLLQGQDLISAGGEEWLDIVTAVAWQAARFIKPNTGRGGSMDPCDYLKVKCVASGSPNESKLIKGVVCTKNIKHKRMMSQYKNARLLLLGGELEFQRVPNQLASFEKLLQQENDHLKKIVSKIEAHRPNVLLVEKSVSSVAIEHLLAKEISLVLNVKRPLLERIARCTGASITPSTDYISTARLGHCELFHLEKVSEDHEAVNQFKRKPSKTLMFIEGCPRRLGCTVVLRGNSREELKKVKQVVQYAVFAAYHLSLETSFLADEGASLPKMASKSLTFIPENSTLDKATAYREEITLSNTDSLSLDITLELGLQESLSELDETGYDENLSTPDEFTYRKALSEACDENLALDATLDEQNPDSPDISNQNLTESLGQSGEVVEVLSPVKVDEGEEYFSANDSHQSILVSFSSHNMVNGSECERPRLLRIKFYGPSDKPLGRYLRDDLFDQSCLCRVCKESAEAHVICYTHQHANLTINVKRLPSVKLPGEQDGKIWMWHRCLQCTHIQGIPPATRRVVMSDAAWGLSFGKFLELSFSNHATGNRLASCGHSLQRDCLRFYGFGNMVAFFRYSPINILSVRLPPSVLEFNGPGEKSWIRKEAYELLSKAKALHGDISSALEDFSTKSLSSMDEFSDASELHNHILELKDMLSGEKTYYEDLLQLSDKDIPEQDQVEVDILEINRLRHSLLIGSHVWDRRLYLLDSLLKRSSSPKAPIPNDVATVTGSRDSDTEDNMSEYSQFQECPHESVSSNNEGSPYSSQFESDLLENYVLATRMMQKEGDDEDNITSLERLPSAASILSDKIDSAWSGADLAPMKPLSETLSFGQISQKDVDPSFVRLKGPTRVHSFDSAQRLEDRIRKGLPPSSLYLSTLRSFHASGDYRYMVRDPVKNVQRTYSQVSPREAEKLALLSSPSFLSPISLLPEGARMMVVPSSQNDIVLTVYDNEPTSIVSYALSSKEYGNWAVEKPELGSNIRFLSKVNSLASDLSRWQSFSSMDSDSMTYGSDDATATVGSFFADHSNSSPHLRISFEDESSSNSKAKFSVTCYFAKQFDSLRRRCCPSEIDFVRSLSRCKRWSAQGGKSNVYFAKTFDERFIIKQVTKTELDSFEEFAPEYFKYLTDSISSGSPTCLAKVLGIYQVTVKHMKVGKEVKMDLMVMENLFFGRNISKVYDLKGSARSRYNSDTTGANKVLLDMNLLETLRTDPIFLGSKAKRTLERAVWNDTSFLASVDVMDYSLLVGVDEERKELVMGIIDFMRQYTWDKHLETWVKASGILGGPKNASPTIVSPKQYKKRFRKAMTSYFLTVPDQWSS